MAGRILIVDDVATNRMVLQVKLAAAHYDVTCAASGEEALATVAAGGIDLVVMDMRMPGLSGAETCACLRADPSMGSVPVILVTASDDGDARMQGLASGADDFLTKPVDDIALLARVRSLLRTRDEERTVEAQSGALLGMDGPEGFAEPPVQTPYVAGPASSGSEGRVALISGGDGPWTARLRERLRPLFREEVALLHRDAALGLVPGTGPDLFVIEADLDTHNAGLRLLSELRSRQATRHAALIVVLQAGDTDRAATALDLGASDVAYRPFPADELAMRIRTQLSRKRRADRMRDTLETGLKMAVIDPLTGLHNRRYGMHHLQRVATRCAAQGIGAGLVLMDIDHFKAVNDRYGHPVGDRVLSRAAQLMKARLRAEDMICRIGGEEFLAVLPDSTLEQTRAAAERLRRAIEEMEIPLQDGTILRVTISLGVTVLEQDGPATERSLAAADRALYVAKDGGRNQVAERASDG